MWDKNGYFVRLSKKAGISHTMANQNIMTHHQCPYLQGSQTMTKLKLSIMQLNLPVIKQPVGTISSNKWDKFISSMKVAYLHRKQNPLEPEEDDIESMQSNFQKSEESRFITLSGVPRDEFLHDPNFSDNKNSNKSSVTVSTTKNKNRDIVDSPVLKMSLIKVIEPLAKAEKEERNLSPSKILFLPQPGSFCLHYNCLCCIQK